jgi:hypothetical protein
MSVLGGVGKTLANVTDKVSKASKVKAIKLKVKFDTKTPRKGPDLLDPITRDAQ